MRLAARLPLAGGLMVAGAAVVVAALATGAQLGALQVVCEQDICATLEQPTKDLLDQVAVVGLSAHGWAVLVVLVQWAVLLTFCVLGLLMTWRRPSLLAAVSSIGLIVVALQSFLGAVDAHGLVLVLLVIVSGLNQASLFLILALFPDGRWHPGFLRRWALPVLAGISAASMANTAGVPLTALDGVQALTILLMVVAQVHRYFRRSDWVARQQTKWVVVGFVVLATVIAASQVLGAKGLISQFQLPLVLAVYVAFFLMGIGFTFALLRYRLYDVGLVLWRTFVYGTGLIAVLVLYFVFVALAAMTLARQTASVLGIATVAVAGVGGAWFAGRLKGRLQRRLYGPGDIAAALASTIATPGGGGELAATIARALALPYAEVRDADGVVASTHGVAPESGAVREPVVDAGGAIVGELALAPAYGAELDARDRRALAEVLPFVVLVLRAQHETEELRQARIAAAGSREDERRRLRRDLHDGVGPLLASQLVTLDTIKVAEERGVPVGDLFAALEEQARSAIGEIRSITRDLRPPILDAGGLAAALTAEIARVRGVRVRSDVRLDGLALPAAVEVNVLRIVQEALTNVVRHAGASDATVAVVASDGAVTVLVEDNGVGRGDAEHGVGTSSMRERAEELGGTVHFERGPDGQGTRVRGRIPL